jgi:hypothetical protein
VRRRHLSELPIDRSSGSYFACAAIGINRDDLSPRPRA